MCLFFGRFNKIPDSNLYHTSVDTLLKVIHVLNQQMIFDAIYTMANMHGPENQGVGVGMAVFNMTSNDQFLHFFFSFCIFRHCSSRGLNYS